MALHGWIKGNIFQRVRLSQAASLVALISGNKEENVSFSLQQKAERGQFPLVIVNRHGALVVVGLHAVNPPDGRKTILHLPGQGFDCPSLWLWPG